MATNRTGHNLPREKPREQGLHGRQEMATNKTKMGSWTSQAALFPCREQQGTVAKQRGRTERGACGDLPLS